MPFSYQLRRGLPLVVGDRLVAEPEERLFDVAGQFDRRGDDFNYLAQAVL